MVTERKKCEGRLVLVAILFSTVLLFHAKSNITFFSIRPTHPKPNITICSFLPKGQKKPKNSLLY